MDKELSIFLTAFMISTLCIFYGVILFAGLGLALITLGVFAFCATSFMLMNMN